MLPSVTGMRLFTMNCDQVILAPASMPCGIKNMLATECSKPSVMNALMGSQMASSLPPVLWLDIAPHTPRHTSQLQRMALEKATVQGSDTFIVAMPTAAACIAGGAMVLAWKLSHARKSDPAKFAEYDATQFFTRSFISTAPLSKPLIITITLPVKSSAPVSTTSANPVGRPTAPLRKLQSPGLLAASCGLPPPTWLINSAPMPMSAPAVKPSVSVLSSG
mmetsp:Transcript_4812/g.14800  ORF Transcript_4812/g.14800 Transcript_4812/m.14800 type:complete len:220 (+) Transcript_4812:153-812(+)